MNKQSKTGAGNLPRREKCISWCYPTSDNAVKAGMGKSGCYALEILDNGLRTSKASSFHPDLETAIRAADAMPEPYSRYSVNIYNQ